MVRQISNYCSAFGKVISKPNIQISFLSYLLQGKKNVLIDTVPEKTAELWSKELLQLVPGMEIDALILNHSEEDHSGALAHLLEQFPELPIFCTPACKERLKDIYPYANFICVENGISIEIGDFSFRFIHTPGLHWNDNMVTFFENEQILFSNDLFGQYIANEALTDDAISAEDMAADTISYFEKVFASASAEQKRVIAKIKELNFRRIAPGHGVVIDENLQKILALYSDRCLI